MKKRQGRSEGRRREILMAALSCFCEHGISGSTIDMIRERSGASVGSLYHHFGNKEKIAVALYSEGMNDHYSRLRKALEEVQSAEHGVKSIVATFINWIADNPEWARFVFYSRSQVAQIDKDEAVKQGNREHWGMLKEWFSPLVQSGSVKHIPPECYSSIIVGPAQDYARRWLSGRASTDIREYIDVFSDAAWLALKP
jgi:AcrR family transcriptional regulator